MSLRKRAFLYILITFLLLVALMAATSNYIALGAFKDVERRFLEQDMDRVKSHLHEALRQVGRLASDWGAWDDMYFFTESKDPSLFRELLDPMALRALNLDVMVVMDKDLNPLVTWSISDMGEEGPLSPVAQAKLKAIAPNVLKISSEGSFQDTFYLGENLYIAGFSPILLTNHTGPSRGFLMTGKAFDNALLEIVADTKIDFYLVPLAASPSLSPGEVEITPCGDGAVTVRQRWDSFLSSVNPLSIEFTQPRWIYNQGRRAIFHSYLWLFLSGAGILAVVMTLLNSLVLRRLEGLRLVSDAIVSGGRLDLRAPLSGSDEISSLSASFNSLMETLENLVNDIPDPLFICDLNGAILLTNNEAQRALGDGAEIAGRPLSTLLKKTVSKSSRARLNFTTGDVYEAELAGPEGVGLPVEVRKREIRYGKRPLLLFVARDITERKTFEQRLAKKAYFDELTGLPNRSAFLEDLGKVMKGEGQGEAHAVALINLDRFKLVNEQVGNVNGDRLLIIIGRRVEEALGEGDRVYRTGGDEYSLLVPFHSVEEMEIELKPLMEKVHQAISAPSPVGVETIFPSASIGVITHISEGVSPSEIINRAAEALKEAKKAGLGFTSYASAGRTGGKETVNILRLSAEMHAGLEKGEFIPYFQPIYSTETGNPVGFETLARWLHPARGFLGPASFVPAAEHTGFVGKIDMHMMKNALRASEALQKKNPGLSLFFSSNGSATFFQTLYAEEILEAFLKQTGADPTLFTLEITESLLIENLVEISEKLNKLKSMGIKIALDDFGTGFSSLQYLNQLPLDYIKLDRAFVARLFKSQKDERLLRMIIHLAGELQLKVIAEGVETKKQYEWLKEAGCENVQGFLLSRPLPWEGVEGLLKGRENS